MNAIGLRTLFLKEVQRFLRVPGQTLLSPLISTTLYFLVFGYSLGGSIRLVDGVPYLLFIVPGLVFLGIANNAVLNTSSSLFIHKLNGTVVDLLVAPLGPTEMLAGFIGGGMVRGLSVGFLTWLVAVVFTGLHFAHPIWLLVFLGLSAYCFATLGMLAGLWAEKFEQMNVFPTFVMLPLTFLGGVFYSVRALPDPWRTVSLFNPMVYMADGLRYGMIDHADFSPWIGSAGLFVLALVATSVGVAWLRSGYKLRQ